MNGKLNSKIPWKLADFIRRSIGRYMMNTCIINQIVMNIPSYSSVQVIIVLIDGLYMPNVGDRETT